MVMLLILINVILVVRLILRKKIIGQTGNIGTKNIKIMVPLKYLSNL